VKLLNSHTSIL